MTFRVADTNFVHRVSRRRAPDPPKKAMKPPKFRYLAATRVDQALDALQETDARVIAGGQSLVPMLNFRLLRPALLVDINRLRELDLLEQTPAGGLRIGALTRHHRIETSPLVRKHYPVLSAAVEHIGHLAIRNRGTLGGSLSHADPAAEHLLMAVLLEAKLTLRSARGSRTVEAPGFIAGALSTTLEADELLVAAEYPALAPRTGWGFEEYARRSGDFALVACGVLIEAAGGRVTRARIAVAGGANGPIRVPGAEAALQASACEADALDAAALAVRELIEPNVDLQASAELRHHLLDTLVRRTCAAAWQRSGGADA